MRSIRIPALIIIAAVAFAGGARAESKIVVVQAAEKPAKVSGDAEGVIKGVDAEEHRVKIDHGPIKGTLEMGAMMMAFRVAPEIDLEKIKSGDKVKFTVSRDEKGLFVIEKMTPAN